MSHLRRKRYNESTNRPKQFLKDVREFIALEHIQSTLSKPELYTLHDKERIHEYFTYEFSEEFYGCSNAQTEYLLKTIYTDWQFKHTLDKL